MGNVVDLSIVKWDEYGIYFWDSYGIYRTNIKMWNTHGKTLGK